MTDYISRADAIDCTELIEWLTEVVMDEENWELNAVAYGEIICRKLVKLGVLEVTEEPSYYIRPSADAESDDLIIKGAKGIKDGLYNIKDGKLFQYKAKGGTVRTYPIVSSADAEPKWNCTANFVAEQLDRLRKMTDEEKWEFFKRFFDIKGGDSE